ncbi:MAG: hypothetical protein ACJATT_002830 [Myxococcota bacterium]|jgi:hypothetical protein
MAGSGTEEDPWTLTTPPGVSEFEMHIDEYTDVLHCQVGEAWQHYRRRGLEDLYTLLKNHGDWMELGDQDEEADTKPGTVEHWARSTENPVGGWYGLRKGCRGHFAHYVTPVLKEQSRAEFEKREQVWWVRAI